MTTTAFTGGAILTMTAGAAPDVVVITDDRIADVGASELLAKHPEAEGSIAPGLRADLVVLDGALDAQDPPRVAETWVAGERVHSAVDG